MADSRKILFVTSGLGTGGAEIFLVDLVMKLMGFGMTCSVVSLTGKGTQGERLERAECEVIAPADAATGFKERLAFARNLKHLVRERRPDIVQGWMYHGNLAATLATKGRDAPPVVWSVHHSLYDLHKRPFMFRAVLSALKFLRHRPAAIHYCSSISAIQHEKYGFLGGKKIVIPNGVDCVLFAPDPTLRAAARAQMGLESYPEAPVVGHIARYHPMKDHTTFLCAAAFLAAARPDARFVLVGKDVDEKNAALTGLRETLGLKGKAFFLGERANIGALLNGMDIVSTSSAWGESFPIAIAEAMATGVSCVATDIGDCAHLIGKTGIVVPPRDGDALGRAWLTLLSEPLAARNDRKEKARKRILENFDIESVSKRFFDFYEGLNSPSSPPEEEKKEEEEKTP